MAMKAGRITTSCPKSEEEDLEKKNRAIFNNPFRSKFQQERTSKGCGYETEIPFLWALSDRENMLK